MTTPTPTPTPTFSHDLVFSDWLDYVIYVPAVVLGLVLCFHGFQLSRKTRMIFGFTVGFYVVYFGAPRVLQNESLRWLIIFGAAIAGGGLGVLTQKYYKLGLVLMGACYGFAVGYSVILCGLYMAWCGYHLVGYTLVLLAFAGLCAFVLRNAKRRARRQLIMLNTAFVGAFICVESADAFFGKYLGYDIIKYNTTHCIGPDYHIGFFILAQLALFFVGLCVQVIAWRNHRLHMRDHFVDDSSKQSPFVVHQIRKPEHSTDASVSTV